MSEHIHIISWGGLGDALLATPAIYALKRRESPPKVTMHNTCWPHYEIYLGNPYIDSLRPPGLRDRIERRLLPLLGLRKFSRPDYGILRPSLFYRTNASEVIGEVLNVRTDGIKPMLFLSESEDASARQLVARYEIPVAIQVTGQCSPNKLWPLENWTALVARNPGYTFVQLGTAEEPLVPGVVDLRGIPLRVALGVIKWVRSFVGIDSVFGHVTAVFGTPGVVIFGPSTPVVHGHAHNQNLFERMPCSPCIAILGPDACPYGTPCMKAISVEQVERALAEQVANATHCCPVP